MRARIIRPWLERGSVCLTQFRALFLADAFELAETRIEWTGRMRDHAEDNRLAGLVVGGFDDQVAPDNRRLSVTYELLRALLLRLPPSAGMVGEPVQAAIHVVEIPLGEESVRLPLLPFRAFLLSSAASGQPVGDPEAGMARTEKLAVRGWHDSGTHASCAGGVEHPTSGELRFHRNLEYDGPYVVLTLRDKFLFVVLTLRGKIPLRLNLNLVPNHPVVFHGVQNVDVAGLAFQARTPGCLDILRADDFDESAAHSFAIFDKANGPCEEVDPIGKDCLGQAIAAELVPGHARLDDRL